MKTQVPHLLLVAALGAALALASVGCSDGTTTAPRPIDSRSGIVGLWQGTLSGTPLHLRIEEAPDRSLVGDVTLGEGEDSLFLTIAGTVWTAPTTFTLFLDCEDDRFRTLRGTVEKNRVSGDYAETDESNRTRTLSWEASRLQTIAPL